MKQFILFLLLTFFAVGTWGQTANDYREAAESGDKEAQYMLGLFYGNGQGGVSEDKAESASWYQKAAEQGHAKSQYALGLYYHQGRGVIKDYEQAFSWFQKGAEQGHAYSQNMLGAYYFNGYGVTKDTEQAASWYLKAAEQGFVDAQYNLGILYEKTKDITQSLFWYQKAAEQGNTYAQKALAKLQDVKSSSGSDETNKNTATSRTSTAQKTSSSATTQGSGWIKQFPSDARSGDREAYENQYHYATKAKYHRWSVPQQDIDIHILLFAEDNSAVITIIFPKEEFSGSALGYFEAKRSGGMFPGEVKISGGRWFWLWVPTEAVKNSSLSVDIWSMNENYQANINAVVKEWHLRFEIPQFTVTVSERRTDLTNRTANPSWIAGNWFNSETYHEITFEADGTFSTGDDCITTGKYTVQGNTVSLKGKTVCPDCEDCEESDYNETMTIKGESLEGYEKFQ